MTYGSSSIMTMTYSSSSITTEVLKSERNKAFKKYKPSRDMVKETISFGRRIDGPPNKVYFPPSSATFPSPDIEHGKYSKSMIRNCSKNQSS